MLLNQIVFARKNSGGGILLNYKQLNIFYKTHIYAIYNSAKRIDKRQKIGRGTAVKFLNPHSKPHNKIYCHNLPLIHQIDIPVQVGCKQQPQEIWHK